MHDQAGENGDEQPRAESTTTQSESERRDATSAARPEVNSSAVSGFAGAAAAGGIAIAALVGLAKRGGKVIPRSADNVPWRSMDGAPPRSNWAIPDDSARRLPEEFVDPEGVADPRVGGRAAASPGLSSAADPSSWGLSWRVPYYGARAIERSQRGRRTEGGGKVDTAPYAGPLVEVLEAGRGCSMAGDGQYRPARVWAWGSDPHGLTGNAPPLWVGREPAWADFVIDFSLGDGHALAVVVARDVGGSSRGRPRIVAWGDQSLGRCETPVELAGSVAAQQVAAGAAHSVALDMSGVVYCWGDNRLGQCDPPEGMPRAERITAGGCTSIAVARTGTLWTWGDDSFGQCAPPNSLASVRAIDAGERHVAAVTHDGRVVCWGDGSLGQCSVPQGLRDARDVSAGGSHTLVLTGDGKVISFGSNASGQCEVPIPADSEAFVAISAGHDHSLALTDSGCVVAWGNNAHGQCDPPAELCGAAADSVIAKPR